MININILALPVAINGKGVIILIGEVSYYLLVVMKAHIVSGTCVEVAAKHHKVGVGGFHPTHQLLHLVAVKVRGLSGVIK